MNLTSPVFGQTTISHSMSEAAVASAVFGLIGIGLLLAGYFLFDWLTRRIDIQEQLNKGNTAVAIVVGALLLAIAYVAAHAVS